MPSLAEKWYKQGKQEGIQEGEQKGIREGLYRAIDLELQVKFGKEGESLFKKIRQIKEIEKLQEIIILLGKGVTLHEIEKTLK